MRRDDVSDSFLYINEIRQKKSVSNPSRVVALSEQSCVYRMIGREELNGAVNKLLVKNIRAVQSRLIYYQTAAICFPF